MAKPATSLKAFKAKQTLTRRQQDDARHNMLIETTKWTGKMSKFISAQPGTEEFEKNEMTMAQLKAADMLLARAVPVLSAVQVVDGGGEENLTREELEARVKDMVINNPALAIMAGLIPKVIDDTD